MTKVFFFDNDDVDVELDKLVVRMSSSLGCKGLPYFGDECFFLRFWAGIGSSPLRAELMKNVQNKSPEQGKHSVRKPPKLIIQQMYKNFRINYENYNKFG